MSIKAGEAHLAWKGNVWEGGLAGLYYVQNRWYDPASRGFISGDPIGLAGGINTYAYAGNDPINGWDPNGLRPQLSCNTVMTKKAGYVDMGYGPVLTSPAEFTVICEIWDDGTADSGPFVPSYPSGTPLFHGGTGATRPDEHTVWHSQLTPCQNAISSTVVSVALEATFVRLGIGLWEGAKTLRALPALADAVATDLANAGTTTGEGQLADYLSLQKSATTYAKAVGQTAASAVVVGNDARDVADPATQAQDKAAAIVGNLSPYPFVGSGVKLGYAIDVCGGWIK